MRMEAAVEEAVEEAIVSEWNGGFGMRFSMGHRFVC
tara:strand:- start:936 stop:1043 length:108 start_codon:yes stop_codon:yes gene_type:complete